jgi:hypothetical protein
VVSLCAALHYGAAANLDELVNFYNSRFSIGLTDEQKQQRIAFLNFAITGVVLRSRRRNFAAPQRMEDR